MCFYRINKQLKAMLIHDWVNQQLYKTVGTIKYIVAIRINVINNLITFLLICILGTIFHC